MVALVARKILVVIIFYTKLFQAQPETYGLFYRIDIHETTELLFLLEIWSRGNGGMHRLDSVLIPFAARTALPSPPPPEASW